MSKYSLTGSEAFDKRVDHDLATIIKMVATPDTHSIILVGGFGRGEGTVINDTPFNDYDIVVVGPKKKNSVSICGDFAIEISYKTKNEMKHAPCTLFNYDMRYGGHVIYGDTTILDTMPRYSVEEIPLLEGTFLLLNRVMLHIIDKNEKHLVKLFLAMGDAVFLSQFRHELSYKIKAEEAETLFLEKAVPEHEYLISNYRAACRFKLYGEPFAMQDDTWEKALQYFVSFALWYEGYRLNKKLPTPFKYAKALAEDPASLKYLLKNLFVFHSLTMPFTPPQAKLLLEIVRKIKIGKTHFNDEELLCLWKKLA